MVCAIDSWIEIAGEELKNRHKVVGAGAEFLD
jgi:hypothetical protein